MLKKCLRLELLLLLTLLLGGCAPSPPDNPNNICAIFKQYPRWYWATKATERKWGIPISVQMAIIRQESHFVADAKPPRKKLLGFIPWTRPTSAYGYAQAVDGTWDDYISQTKNMGADRDAFADASDFVGWYANQAKIIANVSKSDAYSLYLAYHEGIGGYQNRSYLKKKWLMQVASKVERNAETYRTQLRYCASNIPRPSIWNLWLL